MSSTFTSISALPSFVDANAAAVLQTRWRIVQAAAARVLRRLVPILQRAQSHERHRLVRCSATSLATAPRSTRASMTHIDPAQGLVRDTTTRLARGMAGQLEHDSRHLAGTRSGSTHHCGADLDANVFLEPNSLEIPRRADPRSRSSRRECAVGAGAGNGVAAAAPAIAAGLAKVPVGNGDLRTNAKLANRQGRACSNMEASTKTIERWGLDLGSIRRSRPVLSRRMLLVREQGKLSRKSPIPGAGPLAHQLAEEEQGIAHRPSSRKQSWFKAGSTARYQRGIAVNSGVYAELRDVLVAGNHVQRNGSGEMLSLRPVPTATSSTRIPPLPVSGLGRGKLVGERYQFAFNHKVADIRRCSVARASA